MICERRISGASCLMSRGCHVREFPTHNALSQDSTIRALSQDSTRNRTTGARRLNPARCLICIWHSLVWSLPPPRVWSRLTAGRKSLSIARFNSSIKGWHSGTTRRPHAHTQSGTRLYDDYMLPAGSLDGRGGSCEISSLPNALLAPSSNSPAWHQGRWLGAP